MPVEVAEGVWWVGKRLENDAFQCHAYLIVDGDDCVLLDPGSPLTIDDTLDKVSQVVDLGRLRYLVCHHPDPDIAASLPLLSQRLTRPDVVVVTEWRAKALLKHYGHRFDYWLIEEHDWVLPLGDGRRLEFQLTPYLHFPGAFMSFDTGTRTLFSSDLFGGFVPDAAVLVADDLAYVLESAQPFHQHYMPSTALLQAGLGRVRQRWPEIDLIAPQHGHLIPRRLVDGAFAGLASMSCGVFALADRDHDLARLLRLAEAKGRLSESLLTIADPASLVASLDNVLQHADHSVTSSLYVDVPDDGWTRWTAGSRHRVTTPPLDAASVVELAGTPVAFLTLDRTHPGTHDDELLHMLTDMADSIRPAIDQYVAQLHDAHRMAALRRASMTDPLTGVGNRRALQDERPNGDYALISLDLDWFKRVNDEYGHAAGDHVLRSIADVMLANVRDGDLTYRLGGEEFLVVLPRTDGPTATGIAERIRTAIGETVFDGYAPKGRITASAGVVAATHADVEDFDLHLARADAALYASKDLGRDRVTLAT